MISALGDARFAGIGQVDHGAFAQLRAIPVAVHQGRAVDPDLAGLVVCGRGAVLIAQFYLHAFAVVTDGDGVLGIAGRLVQVPVGAAVGLGGAVHVAEAGVGQGLHQLTDVLGGVVVAAEEDPAQRAEVVFVQGAAQQQLADYAGHGEQHGGAPRGQQAGVGGWQTHDDIGDG